MRDFLAACDPLPTKLGALKRPEPVKPEPGPAPVQDPRWTEGDLWGEFERVRGQSLERFLVSKLIVEPLKVQISAVLMDFPLLLNHSPADAVGIGMYMPSHIGGVIGSEIGGCIEGQAQRDNPCEGGIDWSADSLF